MVGLTIHTNFPNAAIAAGAAPVWIVIYSRPTPVEAAEKALSLVGQVQHQISVFQARNGFYTVVLGPVWPRSAESIRNAYVSNGIVPSDAFVSSPGRCCVTSVNIAAALFTTGSGPVGAETPVDYRVYEPRHGVRGNSLIGIEFAKGLDWVLRDEPVVSLEIKRILPGSRLPDHGIKPGDQILSADRYVFRSISDFANYMTNQSIGSTTLLEILPSGAVSTEQVAVGILSRSQIGPIDDNQEPRPPPSAANNARGEGWRWVVLGGAILLCLAFCGRSGSSGRAGSSGRSSDESSGERMRDSLQREENDRRLRGSQ